jgi:hypothetical protein
MNDDLLEKQEYPKEDMSVVIRLGISFFLIHTAYGAA